MRIRLPGRKLGQGDPCITRQDFLIGNPADPEKKLFETPVHRDARVVAVEGNDRLRVRFQPRPIPQIMLFQNDKMPVLLDPENVANGGSVG